MEEINKTLSVCPACLKVVEARIICSDGIVTMHKECPEHGSFACRHIWDSEQVYRKMSKLFSGISREANGLVLNVTNQCNLNCPFCFARANERQQAPLGQAQIEAVLARHRGTIAYLSGGEPTTMESLFSDILSIKKKGYQVGLFTNGKKLAERKYVSALKEAGLDFVILQFDSLDDEDYRFFRGEPLLEIKLRAIRHLESCGIPCYLFVMLAEKKSLREIGALVDFVRDHRNHVKIINFNPVWEMGRVGPHEELTTSSILAEIESQIGLTTRDFLDSTEFSFYLFEVFGRGSRERLNVQTLCELRCYVYFLGRKIIPLSKMVDLQRINSLLQQISTASGVRRQLRLFLLGLEFSRAFFFSGPFRAAVGRFLVNALRALPPTSLLKLSPFSSIIVGTFQTAQRLDFAALKTCNLYSDYPGEQGIFSACVRQILIEGLNSSRSFSTASVVDSYKEVLRKEDVYVR